MQWTQKETDLLKDLKGQEQLCVDKYTRHAEAAADPQLKNLFSQLAQNEQQHLQTIRQMEQGTVPQMSGDSKEKQNDCFLCSDVLAGEKHVSALYDTCVFEFKDGAARNVLSHIQQEEQQHGKMLFDYMQANGMYQ